MLGDGWCAFCFQAGGLQTLKRNRLTGKPSDEYRASGQWCREVQHEPSADAVTAGECLSLEPSGAYPISCARAFVDSYGETLTSFSSSRLRRTTLQSLRLITGIPRRLRETRGTFSAYHLTMLTMLAESA